MAERDFNLQMTGEQVKDALQQLEDRVAEGWAVGEHDGVPVTSGSPYFENNSKWWAQQAGLSAQAAADSAATAEQEVEEGIREGIAGAYVQESATPGAVVTFDDGADNIPLKDLAVNLAINQPGTGDPSPSNVRPIYPVTKAEVTRTGKNLYFKTMANRYINASGVISSSTVYNVMCAYVKEGQTYTISNNGTAATSASYGYYEAEPADAATALTGRLTAANGTFTATMNAYIAVVVLAGNNAVQLELGSTATTYEPYAGQQYVVDFGDNVVYGGELDVTTGVLTARYGYADLGSLTWTREETASAGIYRFSASLSPAPKTRVATAKCSIFATYLADEYRFHDNSVAMPNGGSIMLVRCDAYTDPAVFKTAMAGVQLVYELATPISIQLTPTEVDTLRGDNVIWADCGDITNCEYRADLKMYIDKVVGA